MLPGVSPYDSSKLIQEDLNRILLWAKTWKLDFKAAKSKEVIFHTSRERINGYDQLVLGGEFIPRGPHHKHLGLFLDENLNFQHHITETIVKCNALLNPLKSLKATLQSKHLEKNLCIVYLTSFRVLFNSI